MAQAGTSKRRASLPSSDSANVLSNVDRKHPLKPPRIAWVKHGKYIALGGAGTAYLEIVERIQWSLASENWVRWVARAGVTLHGLTVVSAPSMGQHAGTATGLGCRGIALPIEWGKEILARGKLTVR